MSYLDTLLQGVDVEWKTLGEVTFWDKRFQGVDSTLQKTVLKFKHISAEKLKRLKVPNGTIKLLSTGNFDGFTTVDLVKDEINIGEVITIPTGGTANLKYYNGNFIDSGNLLGSSSNLNLYSLKYIYYYLLNINDIIQNYFRGSGVKHPSMPEIINILIPIPPLPVQSEIVRILDTFTELTAELTAELLKRRVQYKYYMTLLFDNVKESDLHSIAKVCHIEKGTTPIQKAIPGKYPMVVTTTERKSCETYQFDAKAVCIPLVSSRGHGVASLNQVYYQEGKFALGNILCAIIPKNEEQVCSKYLYYYFQLTKEYTLVPLMKGGANVALRINDIEKVKVPIPSLEEQSRIVSILDKFDTLTNSISEGLPKEIELRKKQYEYYRDMLLTFPSLRAAGEAIQKSEAIRKNNTTR